MCGIDLKTSICKICYFSGVWTTCVSTK